MEFNMVYLVDNLEFLRELDSETIDLIYIDPPFFTGVDYKEFSDLWSSLEDYLDPEDPTKTIEGHPAPKRALLIAKKAVKPLS